MDYKYFNKLCRICLIADPVLKSIFDKCTDTTLNDEIVKDEIEDDEHEQSQPPQHRPPQPTVFNQTNILKSISSAESQQTIMNIIELCTGLQILINDDLPKCICKNCLDQLLINYRFRTLCHQSNEMLLNILVEKEPTSTPIHTERIYATNISSVDKQLQLPQSTTIENIKLIKIDQLLYDDSNLISMNNNNNNNNNQGVMKLESNSGVKRSIKNKKSVQKTIKKYNRKVKIQCEICGEMKGDINRHKLLHIGDRKFKCDICTKLFLTRIDVKKHMYAHADRRPHHCSICNKRFRSKQQLKEHSYTHTGERNFVCEICHHTFPTLKNRTRHLLIHTQDRRHNCTYCAQTFLTSSALKSHINIHTGERPYSCGVCDATFNNTTSVSVHRRIHRRDGKFYQCDQCPFESDEIRLLKQHKTTKHVR